MCNALGQQDIRNPGKKIHVSCILHLDFLKLNNFDFKGEIHNSTLELKSQMLVGKSDRFKFKYSEHPKPERFGVLISNIWFSNVRD